MSTEPPSSSPLRSATDIGSDVPPMPSSSQVPTKRSDGGTEADDLPPRKRLRARVTKGKGKGKADPEE
jgi:hypothetical protein